MTNNERVGKALELVAQGLSPFVERECRAKLGADWARVVNEAVDRRGEARPGDVQFLLKTIVDNWATVFRRSMSHAERNFVGELIDVRNRWAHQDAFTSADAQRALDTAQRLLAAIASNEHAQEVDRMRAELLRSMFDEQARAVQRRSAAAPTEGQPAAGLRPWREIVTPHPDVAAGRYQQAEFAADLYQVWKAEGADEYRDPVEFFRRTFITDGLRDLLLNAVRRLRGEGGDPIVELQTNFGGGKTHSLIALYHLASGHAAHELPGVEAMLAAAEVEGPPSAAVAVLVGQRIPPSTPSVKPDGTEVRTLWGELAWQLGEAEGFGLVTEADRTGTNPGAALTTLLRRYSPCVILIDEWVRYAGQLWGQDGLSAGSFDAQFSFAQALLDAAKDVNNALIVISIPSSEIEQGGEGGQRAMERLRSITGRVSRPWKPASVDEGFEIVRRRLFEDVPAQLARERDAVVRSFVTLYERGAAEFPSDARSADYAQRITAAYPIHPELFDRLFKDWSTLETFQRTRGVLRLMASVIHALWEREDRSLLIMPGSLPIDAPPVLWELTRYLPDPWTPVIEADVDGASSLPLRLDRENPNLGRYSATRRTARAVYLGSAPLARSGAGAAQGAEPRAGGPGVDDRTVKLGCCQPGESPAVFGDALRRLSNDAVFLNTDGNRYWYSLAPTLTRLAADKAAMLAMDDVDEEIHGRLRRERDQRGPFAAVHVAPRGPADVADEPSTRLVVLGAEHAHSSKSADSAAKQMAISLLADRVAGGRVHRNALVFCAPDRDRLDDLRQAVRLYLAWTAIAAEWRERGLTDAQRSQAAGKSADFNGVVAQRIAETYQWALLPKGNRADPTDSVVSWDLLRVAPASDPIAERVARRIESEEGLVRRYGALRLRQELDRVPLWRGDAVGVRQLWLDHTQYLYLPRLANQQVLLDAIADGTASTVWETSTFAYAEGFDTHRGRYLGLAAAMQVVVSASEEALVVKAEVAARQLADDRGATAAASDTAGSVDDGAPVSAEATPAGPDGSKQPRRFYGRVALDPVRMARDAGTVAEAVVQHLRASGGNTVQITLEIQASGGAGFDDATVRTVLENADTLNFEARGFEPG